MQQCRKVGAVAVACLLAWFCVTNIPPAACETVRTQQCFRKGLLRPRITKGGGWLYTIQNEGAAIVTQATSGQGVQHHRETTKDTAVWRVASSLGASAAALPCWMRYLACNRITTYLIVAAVAGCGLAFRLLGLGRSIWLDEAWVANSVTAGSLSGMFYYDSWLQTSPPLFLLLVRITVNSLGLSTSVLRLVPLLFGLSAAVWMFILARRVLTPRFALLAWTMFVLSPLAITYSKTLKQYSLELAATTAILWACNMYLERPTVHRFRLLLATVAIVLPMTYGVAFVLPGIILIVCLVRTQFESAMPGPLKWSGLMRGLILAAVGGGILIGIYLVFVSPNTSPALRSYWSNDRDTRSFARVAISDGYGLLFQLPIPNRVLEKGKPIFGALFLIGFALACLKFREGTRRWLEIHVICLLPILLLMVFSGLSLYPMGDKMSLFLLPAIILLFMSSLQLMFHFVLHRFRRKWLEPLLDVGLVSVTLLAVWVGIVKQTKEPLNVQTEDVASTISFLRSNVQREDLLWVHASCSEAFKLYAKMTGWSDVSARFGHTGWPCCPRGIPAIAGSGTGDVRRDLNSRILGNFSGRIWLLYTKRASHWGFVGVDESRIMDTVFRERGCLQKPTPLFHNVGVSFFDCGASQGLIAKTGDSPTPKAGL